MKIVFVIPTKDGGEGFEKLINSINNNVEFASNKISDLETETYFIINGEVKKPLSFIENNKLINESAKVFIVDFLGKMKSINYCLNKVKADLYVMLDDDVYFEKELLYLALEEIKKDSSLRMVSFQTRALPYSGKNIISKFFYDVINIRSLKRLYGNVDPFLFGRFILSYPENLIVPDKIINEDLYLSIINDGKFKIRSEEVFYIGEHSIVKHVKRVLRIEAGRDQVAKLFGDKYKEITNKSKRTIDKDALRKLELYYRFCYFNYRILRFITNSVISKIFKHNKTHW